MSLEIDVQGHKGKIILREINHVCKENYQITFILEGQLDMVIGDIPYSLKSGMYHVIPSNVIHSAVAVTDCKLIDVFNPVREEYR